MEFEYDPAKSTTNLLKHGIDFEEAQSLWEDQNLVRFPIDYGGEKRWGVISHYSGEPMGCGLHNTGQQHANHFSTSGNQKRGCVL